MQNPDKNGGGMSREERAVLAAWNQAHQKELKCIAKKQRQDMLASRKVQVDTAPNLSIPQRGKKHFLSDRDARHTSIQLIVYFPFPVMLFVYRSGLSGSARCSRRLRKCQNSGQRRRSSSTPFPIFVPLLRKEQSSYPTLSTDSLMLGFCCNKQFDCAGMARVRSFHPKASDLAADLAGLKFQPHGYGVHISRLKVYILVVVTMHVS